jgi:hypothetical protein
MYLVGGTVMKTPLSVSSSFFTLSPSPQLPMLLPSSIRPARSGPHHSSSSPFPWRLAQLLWATPPRPNERTPTLVHPIPSVKKEVDCAPLPSILLLSPPPHSPNSSTVPHHTAPPVTPTPAHGITPARLTATTSAKMEESHEQKRRT